MMLAPRLTKVLAIASAVPQADAGHGRVRGWLLRLAHAVRKGVCFVTRSLSLLLSASAPCADMGAFQSVGDGASEMVALLRQTDNLHAASSCPCLSYSFLCKLS